MYKVIQFLNSILRKPDETNKKMNWKNIVYYVNNGSPEPDKRVEKTEEEWKELLTPSQFIITRRKGTEPRGTGEFCTSYDEGVYGCVCCGTHLFDSTIKYSSGSGWPSFTEPIKENAIRYIKDITLGMVRVETVCNTCDAHLGHVFPDGPEPTGLRFCINSESLILIK